jgi:cytochrome c oxidase subunit 3
MTTNVVDVSSLKTWAFGHRSLIWWGTIGLFAIEGSVFALLIMTYLYLHGRTPDWPPGVIDPPALFWGTVNTALLIASAVPNQLASQRASASIRGRRRSGSGCASCSPRHFSWSACSNSRR